MEMAKVEERNHAQEQAKAQLETIIDLVARLEHCMECSDSACELSDRDIYAGLNIWYKDGDVATEEDREQYHNEEEAREAITNNPLSVVVRSSWHVPGEENAPDEYNILLCTGGPACRIIGDLSEYGEPETAKIEYQDWFTPWNTYPNDEEQALLTYAKQFYFGE